MLNKRLVLFDWLIGQLGGSSFEELRAAVNRPELDGFTPDHTSRFIPEIEHLLFDRAGDTNHTDRLIDSREILREMDANIVRHWRHIADKRTRMGQEIFPKYFQWLSLLGTELYLRAYIAERGRLVSSLNAAVRRFNGRLKDARDEVPEFADTDLNHLAFWNATGSGKTLIMHVNLLQIRHYLSRFPRQAPQIDQVILVTPNERLSDQHLSEFHMSGISAQRFASSGGVLAMFRGVDSPVQLIEIQKLADETKEKTVNIEEFETSNLVFIDEGHKGTGGDGVNSQGAWVSRRDRLSATGFSFEYSATFGQALSDRSSLESRYAKSILFEYSYPRFYHDGYGKEYRIMNMPAADNKVQESTQVRTYLFANLVWFYQQLLVYREHPTELEPFRIHKPLLAFVGSSVVKGAADDLSDVATVVDTLIAFAENSDGAALETITELLAGSVPLYDKAGKSVFEGEFRYLQDRYGVHGTAAAAPIAPQTAAQTVYSSMKEELFHGTAGDVSVERLTGSADTEGELVLRFGAASDPFGVVTVGDAKKLADHLIADRNGGSVVERVAERAISDSYFRSINQNSSSITILIGAKKFIEGWSSWRVSSIGLMKLGQSQGPQVIQLFGRGVRLQGYDFRLKRASALSQEGQLPVTKPNDIDYVETLSVFGVRAAYIETFKEIIEKEEGAIEYEIVEIPRKRSHESRYKDLAYVDIDRSRTGPRDLPVWELELPTSEADREKLRVNVTWSVALQAFFSKRASSSIASNTHLGESSFSPEHIRFLDIHSLHQELVEYKNNERYFNLSIKPDSIRKLVSVAQDQSWYILKTPPDTMRFDHSGRIPEWQEIAQVLLRSYVKRFYEYRRAEYENQFLRARPLITEDGGLVQEKVYAYLPKKLGSDQVQNTALLQAVERVRHLVENGWNGGESRGTEPADAGVTAIKAKEHVYYPLLHLSQDATIETPARFTPQGLNDGEVRFVRDLVQWFHENDPPLAGSESFFFRNESRGRGLGFFIADNFYPDFIIWFVQPDAQTVVFVDPKGIRNLGGFDHPKLQFYETIKEVEARLNAEREDVLPPLTLESFVVSTTPHENVMWNTHAGAGRRDKKDFEERHVLFMGDGQYLDKMMLQLQRRND
jgi:hypothetical protein